LVWRVGRCLSSWINGDTGVVNARVAPEGLLRLPQSAKPLVVEDDIPGDAS